LTTTGTIKSKESPKKKESDSLDLESDEKELS